MSIKIEKNIPIPFHRGKSKLPEIPWKEMEVGDSFVYHARSACGLKRQASIHGIKLLIRWEDTEPSGYNQYRKPKSFRVWRIA